MHLAIIELSEAPAGFAGVTHAGIEEVSVQEGAVRFGCVFGTLDADGEFDAPFRMHDYLTVSYEPNGALPDLNALLAGLTAKATERAGRTRTT